MFSFAVALLRSVRLLVLVLGCLVVLSGLGAPKPAAAATAAFGRTIPLADVLAADGTLNLPRGQYGTLDPAGFELVNVPGRAPQFVPANAPLAGGWVGSVGLGTNQPVRALAFDIFSNLYVGGLFTAAGTCMSADGCNYIARWNGTTWSPLGTGTTGNVYALAFDSFGNLYAGGYFTAAGTCTNGCNNIAKWDGTTWSPLGTGVDNTVKALAFESSGNLYAGGSFLAAGTCTNGCRHIAQWNPSTTTWSALGTGTIGNVNVLAFDSFGNLYVGGLFTAAGTCMSADGCNYIARWNGTTWSPLGTGTTGNVYALAFDSFGNLYAGGNFTAAGTCTSANGCNRIAQWNPTTTTWSPLGTGMSNSVYALAFDSSGNLYAGGNFTAAGTCTSSNGCNRIAQWNPTTTTWSALSTGVNNTVYALAVKPNGQPVGAEAANAADNLDVGGDFTRAGVADAGYIAEWNPATTAVTLSGFSAKFDARKQQVRVRWTTQTETNSAGFNVWRKAKDGAWQKLNAALIASKNLDGVTPANYAFQDTTVRSGRAYRYRLEMVSLGGTSEMSQAVRVK